MKANYAMNTSTDRPAILVMDDEEPIRNMVASMLNFLGYRPVTCATGEEAISFYVNAKRSGAPFLAVIMDLIVADGMGGREAALHIRGIDPDARLIVSSGYSADQVMDSPQRYGFLAALEKPYAINELAAVFSQIFGQNQGCGN